VLTRVPPADDGFFAGIRPLGLTIRRDGRATHFELPQRYFDWSLMLAHFPASAAAIRRLLPEGSGLEPVTIAPGLGIVSIGAFEYKRCATLAAYDEMAVMFPVRLRPALPLPAFPLFRPEWFSDLGFYIWKLPVTTRESCDVGLTLWGFPKSVGEITFTENKTQHRRRCSWTERGQHVLTLEVRTSNTSRRLQEFLAYSVLEEDRRLQQTLVQTYGDYDESRFGFDASFALGEHPIADEMRRLGIIDAPIGRLYAPSLQGILPGPSPVPFSTVPAPLQATRVLKSIVQRSGPKRRGRSVAILGGGVAGLSAAHELVERGFDVTVYERRDIAGGKARSEGVSGSSGELHEDLPCEHGFRFFPGFYKHLPDTMARIPYAPTGKTVADNLVAASRVVIDFQDANQLVFPARFPASLTDFGTLLVGTGLMQERTGCTAEEISFYVSKIWQLLTSCEERRLEEYERIPWWSFIEAEDRSGNYQKYLGSTTRTLVAADPKKASTRTVGNILLQMLFDFGTPGVGVDRVLNGPTNEVWIDPWVEHLEKSGVTWQRATALKLLTKDGRLAGVRVADAAGDKLVNERTVTADYYIAAVPVEVMATLLKASAEVTDVDPNLKNIVKLADDVEWMTGIQFYFRERLPLEPGHYMHLDSPWALTSLAQAQFWTTDLRRFGDGTIRDILSVDISEWNTPGFNRKKAKDCTRAEIKDEVWTQLQHSLPFLQQMDPAIVYLDNAIVEKHGAISNDEPLLVNKADHWVLRPEAATGIANLFLAADYVRTYTDLATMEGANEAARRAVNAILEASRSVETPCAVWNLHDPGLLSPWRWIDRYRYFRGLSWDSDFPLFVRGLQIGLGLTSIGATALGGVLALESVAPRGAVPEDEGPAFAVPRGVQRRIGDRIEQLIDAMKRGDARDLRRLFMPYATITIGIRPRTVEEALPFVRAGVIVNIDNIKSVYKLGARVHVRMTVRLNEEGRAAPDVEGHVHTVFVRTEDEGWLIASLRYRREGRPAQFEPLFAV
jgi:15-cis-phytoene desaturase